MGKKRVLWISRHLPVPAQLDFLKQVIGDFDLIIQKEPLSTAEDAVKLALEVKADYVVPVLPLSFIMHLVAEAQKHSFTVLRAEMETLHRCTQYPCSDFNLRTDVIMEGRDMKTGEKIYRHFRFKEFVVLKEIKIITELFKKEEV